MIPNDRQSQNVPPSAIAIAYRAGTLTSQAPTATAPTIDPKVIRRTIPPYRVVLHNDDHNSMEHVIRSLMLSLPGMDVDEATGIMFEAHNHSQATVTICAKEQAEYYRERLESCGLTSTIEPA